MSGTPVDEGGYFRRIFEIGDRAGDIYERLTAQLKNDPDGFYRQIDLFMNVARPGGGSPSGAMAMLDFSSFVTSGLGVTGIELSDMTSQYPDLSFIGVTGTVPEPGTMALVALGGAGWLAMRRLK